MRKLSCAVVLGGLVLAAGAAAEEPKCACPAHQVGVPLLTKVPYISRLFKNVGEAAASCPQECTEVFERIGIDFVFGPDGQAGVCQIRPVDNGEKGCQGTHAGQTLPSPYYLQDDIQYFPPGSEFKRSHEAAGCTQAACKTATHVAVKACTCPGECCPDGQCHCTAKSVAACPFAKLAADKNKLWETIVELSAGQAAAEAALEVQEESLERSAELLESMAGLHAENAKLAAKLEVQDQLHQLVAENTRLKAQVELAEAKAEVMRATVEMTVENERLKMRLADLEQGSGKEVPTSARIRGAKKAR